jgi:hypothetical protein
LAKLLVALPPPAFRRTLVAAVGILIKTGEARTWLSEFLARVEQAGKSPSRAAPCRSPSRFPSPAGTMRGLPPMTADRALRRAAGAEAVALARQVILHFPSFAGNDAARAT